MSKPNAPDPIEEYLRAIDAVPPLTADEERTLWAAIKSDDDADAKRRLIEANLRLVVSIARGYDGRGMNFVDLVQEGNLGLIRAIQRFDRGEGGDFAPFAAQQIDLAITTALG